MKKSKPLPPCVYVRLADADLYHIERHRKRMQRSADGKITQSDAIRALLRFGILSEMAARQGEATRRRARSKSPTDAPVLTKRIMVAPSDLCNAPRPDSERTGYPAAYQRYDVKAQKWRWILVGSEGPVGTPKQIGADHLSEGLVRGVWVRRWTRVGKGWRANLDKTKTVYGSSSRLREQ